MDFQAKEEAFNPPKRKSNNWKYDIFYSWLFLWVISLAWSQAQSGSETLVLKKLSCEPGSSGFICCLKSKYISSLFAVMK
jgi:hypothetical protein